MTTPRSRDDLIDPRDRELALCIGAGLRSAATRAAQRRLLPPTPPLPARCHLMSPPLFAQRTVGRSSRGDFLLRRGRRRGEAGERSRDWERRKRKTAGTIAQQSLSTHDVTSCPERARAQSEPEMNATPKPTPDIIWGFDERIGKHPNWVIRIRNLPINPLFKDLGQKHPLPTAGRAIYGRHSTARRARGRSQSISSLLIHCRRSKRDGAGLGPSGVGLRCGLFARSARTSI